jgi:hypothetical protein
MARPSATSSGDRISRLATWNEHTVVNLATLPLRLLIGSLDLAETQLHRVADTLRGIDPLSDRVAQLERRMTAVEQQPSSANPNPTTTARRTPSTPTAAAKNTTDSPAAAGDTPPGVTAADKPSAQTS